MTVFHVTSWRVAPGRMAEAVANVHAAREIHKRHGFGASAWRTVVAGADPANVWYLLISAGPAEHFANLEALEADTEWGQLVSDHIERPDAAATLLTDGLWQTTNDLPDLVVMASGISPRAQLISGSAPMTPAQRARYRVMAEQAKTIIERNGMTIGFAEAMVAGERTGALSAVVGAGSLADLGAGIERLAADADWITYQMESTSHPDRPTLTTRSIRQEIV